MAMVLSACSTPETRERDANKGKIASIRTELAAGHLMRNQPEFALQEIEKALDADPDNSQANNIMALVQARLRNDDKAEKHFHRAITSNPDNSEAHNNYGVFLCERGRVADALKQFDAAIANPLHRTPEKTNVNAGLCLLQKSENADGATKYFKAALAIDPRSGTALFYLARTNYQNRQYLSARGLLQRYFEVARDSPESLLLAFRVEEALGARDAQASYALRLRGKYPDSAEARQLSKIKGR
jgi:type IV pilus assembly protein PilF